MSDLTEVIGKQTLVVEDLRRRIRELEDQNAKKERATMKAEATKKKLSDKERDEIRAIFDEYDTDKSGSLEPQEVSECAAKLGAKMTPEELDAAVKALDANKDGKISFDEFVEWFTSDSKLGGLSSSKLIAVRLKMRLQKVKRNALSHMRTVDRSEGFGHSFSIRTNRPFDSKFNLSTTCIPMPTGMSVASPAAREVLPDFDWSTPETTSVARVAVRCEKPAELIKDLKKFLPSDMVGGTIDESDPNSAVLYIASDDMEIPYLTALGTQPIAVSVDTPLSFEDLASKALNGVITAFSEFSVNVSASINPQVNLIALIREILTRGSRYKRGFKNKMHPFLGSLLSRGGSVAVAATPIQHTIAHQASQLIADGIKLTQKTKPNVDVAPLQTPEFATFVERALELSYAPNIKMFLLNHFTDDFDFLEDKDEEQLGRRYKHINRATEILRKAGVSEIQTITISTNTNIITVETPGIDVKYILGLLPEGEGKNAPFSRKALAEIKAYYAPPAALKKEHIQSSTSPLAMVVGPAITIATINSEDQNEWVMSDSDVESDSISIDSDRPAKKKSARKASLSGSSCSSSLNMSSCSSD